MLWRSKQYSNNPIKPALSRTIKIIPNKPKNFCLSSLIKHSVLRFLKQKTSIKIQSKEKMAWNL